MSSAAGTFDPQDPDDQQTVRRMDRAQVITMDRKAGRMTAGRAHKMVKLKVRDFPIVNFLRNMFDIRDE